MHVLWLPRLALCPVLPCFAAFYGEGPSVEGGPREMANPTRSRNQASTCETNREVTDVEYGR